MAAVGFFLFQRLKWIFNICVENSGTSLNRALLFLAVLDSCYLYWKIPWSNLLTNTLQKWPISRASLQILENSIDFDTLKSC